MAQVYNTKTGMTLTIPDDQVPFMSSEWKVGAAPNKAATPAPTTPTPAPAVATPSSPSSGSQPAASGVAKATLWGPNGQKEVVQVGSPRASELQSQGWGLKEGSYKAPAGSTPAAGTTPTTPNAQQGDKTVAQMRDEFKAMGIDVTALSDDQLKSAYTMKQMFDQRAKTDKEIMPKNLTTQELDKFMEDAKAELGPYYAERLAVGKQDALNFFADMTQDVNYASQVTLKKQEDERIAKANELNEQGLAYSGLREKAQTDMKSAQEGLVRSNASQYARQLRDKALAFERSYGSSALSQLGIPDLNFAGVAVAPPIPMGGLLGEEQKAQQVAQQQRQGQLATTEMQKRNTLAYGTSPTT